ncbi:MAG: hypothetical protein O3A00_13790, partial [Planctomycetota bacterium]|nr:hypothetical protein [Planctomycetota bacterium]
TFRPKPSQVVANRAVQSAHQLRLKIDSTSWLVMRSVQEIPDGRVRFAHTAPWHIEVKGSQLQPRQEEVEYLITRVKTQLERNAEVLSPASLAEFEKALAIYEDMLE